MNLECVDESRGPKMSFWRMAYMGFQTLGMIYGTVTKLGFPYCR